MNKQLWIAGFAALVMASCQQKEQEDYTVKGTLKNASAQTIYLEEVSLETLQPVIVDSATITSNGAYDLNTLTKGETIYNLRLNGNRFPFVSFINDTKEITIDADFKNFDDPYTIKGSAASESLKQYLYTIGNKVNALNEISYPKDTLSYKKPQRDSIRHEVAGRQESAINDLKSYAADFINKSQHAPLTLYALSSYQSIASNPAFGLQTFTEQEVKTIIANAAKKHPTNTSLASLNQSLNRPQGSKTAPDFTLPDVNGQPVSLSSFKGKYVLVDFWASWCRPCRIENPNVVAAYNQYKDKNFTILGVSLDKEKEPWLKAIKDDNLTWTHVSDLSFWDSKVVPLYNIEAIPYNVLLDPQGNVIADRLTGADLQAKLSEVLK